MPSYIEAGELLMELNDTVIFDTYNDYSMVFDTIDNFPTVDVAPVRHGHWEQGDIYDIGDVCSLCQYDSNREPCTYKYCPWCGARMDGDADANGNDNKTPET